MANVKHQNPSQIPKVLQQLGGKALLGHVINTAKDLGARSCVVITGHQAEQVQSYVKQQAHQIDLSCVLQMPQLGTGHAVQQAVPVLPDDGMTLILSGDVPLTQVDTLKALIALSAGQHMTLLTLKMANPTGYGRVVRQATSGVSANQNTNSVLAIVEQKDASLEQLAIQEIYSGIMVLPTRLLKQCLAKLDNKNAQSEYYLTDIVKFAVADGLTVLAHEIADADQVAGVNSPLQLAQLERAYQMHQAQILLEHAKHIPKLVQDVSQGKTGQLNIGFTSSAGLHPLISLVLRSYREIYPGVQTKLEEAGSQKQLDRLISEKLDIAFLRAPISRDIGLKHLHILDEPMMVALPIGHPLTQKEKISSIDLSDENFVLYRRSSGQGLYDNILYSCYQAGFSPRIIQEAPRPTATLNLVAAGIGITIVPASMHNFWNHEIVYREFDSSIKLNAPLYLITRENENSAKVSNFINLLQKFIKSI